MAIIGTEPMVKDNQRFTQKQVAELLGITDKTVRNYEAVGLMPPGRRIGKSAYYFGRDVKRCWRNYFNQ